MRLWFALEHRLGVLRRRAPVGDWEGLAAIPAPKSALNLSSLAAYLAAHPGREGLDEAEELHAGRLRLFSGRAMDVGNPPAWHRSPLSGETWPCDRHWSLISDAGQSDIKGVWEASRWSWVYPLARAYLRDRDPRHAELFWRWAEDWMAKNPPNLGVNWKCGQEASFRIFAAAWALAAFADAPSTTPSRVQLLARLAHVTGRRIEAHLAYAISQDNNHGISEAVGLITIGTLWPELPGAARHRAKGLKVLARLCDRLINGDGSFSQHSSNYHRVMLDDLCWAESVLRSNGKCLPDDVRVAACRAANFLRALLLPDGSVVRYGADDGARVLQLSGCGYEDFRPTIAACSALFGSAALASGPWDEQAASLCPDHRVRVQADAFPADYVAGGLCVRRRGQAIIAFRAPMIFKARPSHADQLHLSVYEAGVPIVEDLGTLSYNDPGRPWAELAAARFHNVPTVDDLDPMMKASRFLWLPWTTCLLEANEPNRLVASHSGIVGFVVRREVVLLQGAIRIIDTFVGNRDATFSVRWHGRSRQKLEAVRISSSVLGGVDTWHYADASSGLGFFANRYASAIPSHCRVFSLRARQATIVSEIPLSEP